MNNYITICEDSSINERMALNTSKLINYIKKKTEIDILESGAVTNIKRYIENETIEFTFYYKDIMYIATYFVKMNKYEINKVV